MLIRTGDIGPGTQELWKKRWSPFMMAAGVAASFARGRRRMKYSEKRLGI
jgi:hypothetical protein